MSTDLPEDPALDPTLARLIAGLDEAAARAGSGAPAGHGGEDALVTAVVSQLRATTTWDGPPDHLRASILAEARAGAALAAPPAAASPPRPSTVVVPRWRRMAWAVPMTAAAAVVFTLLVLGGQRLLTSPDNGTAYALAGGAVAPQATGTVSVSSAPGGFPVVLDAHDLPGAPAGYYYQAWLIRAGQQPVSLGTFHGRKTGQPIRLWSGVDPAGFELTVNLQSVNDPPGPTSQVALTAQIGD